MKTGGGVRNLQRVKNITFNLWRKIGDFIFNNTFKSLSHSY